MEKCVVIIPALNEEQTIASVINSVPKMLFHNRIKLEVVVINDGSTDRTAEVAERCGADIISHRSPQGVGAAFAAGVRETLRRKADYMVNLDGDGQMNPNDIEKILEPITGGGG